MSHYDAMLNAHLRAASELAGRRRPRKPATTVEQAQRSDRVHARALEVFGNRLGASVWCHCPDDHAFGRWTSPWAMSRESEDGCRRVLTELDRIESALRYGKAHAAV